METNTAFLDCKHFYSYFKVGCYGSMALMGIDSVSEPASSGYLRNCSFGISALTQSSRSSCCLFLIQHSVGGFEHKEERLLCVKQASSK